MATTTNYGWETPDDTDLLVDGAEAIRSLGEEVDGQVHGHETGTDPHSGVYESVQLIEEIDLSGENSVTFSDIPATFRDLELTVYGQATGNRFMHLRFNGDTEANYFRQYVLASGETTPAENEEVGPGTFVIFGRVGANGASQANIVIPQYTGTTLEQTLLAQSSRRDGTTTGMLEHYSVAGWWTGTAAITSITLLLNTGVDSWTAGSIATLRGRP